MQVAHDSSGDIHSDSTTFAGVTNLQAAAGVAAIKTGFGTGSAFVDGYTFLLTTSVSAIPEPGTYAMLMAGLGLLGFLARRRMRQGNLAA